MSNARRLLVVAGLLLAPWVRAQTPELDRARATFAEALTDETAGRTAVALGKFRDVAGVRDTSQVEYRIATCLEALGRRGPALAAYDRAVHLGRGDATAGDVVVAANARIAALAAEMGKLGLVIHGSDAPDVRVDGQPVSRGETGAIMLEPGDHVVDVAAPQTKPARANVSIDRGRSLTLTVDLVPEVVASPPSPPSHLRRDVGIAVIGAGGAFGIGAAVVLLVRNALIDAIHATCPNDVCPIASHDDVESKRAMASSLETPAAVLGGVALVSLAVGVVLVVLGPSRRVTAWIAPSDRGGALFLGGTF